jgi:5-formyltetrahydrofolate cyclo-ligase
MSTIRPPIGAAPSTDADALAGTAADDVDRIAAAKRAMRVPLLTARRARTAAEGATARASVGEHLTAALAGRTCVAAFLPLPTEPLDPALLPRLARRLRVLIPVVTGPEPLQWCEYTPATRPGQLGIEEPDGPWLGTEAIGDADVVLVPALAVAADGYRLGRGGGHYDRTLALRARLRGDRPDELIALVHDEEFGPAVPHDDLDQPVTAVITPTRGLVRLSDR